MMNSITITQEQWITLAINQIRDPEALVPLRDPQRIYDFVMQYADNTNNVTLTFDTPEELTEFVLRNSHLFT